MKIKIPELTNPHTPLPPSPPRSKIIRSTTSTMWRKNSEIRRRYISLIGLGTLIGQNSLNFCCIGRKRTHAEKSAPKKKKFLKFEGVSPIGSRVQSPRIYPLTKHEIEYDKPNRIASTRVFTAERRANPPAVDNRKTEIENAV